MHTGPDENVDQFIKQLKCIAKPCEFKDEEDMLRDKMVFGIRDNSVQEKLLTRGNLKLKEAIDIARAAEITKRLIKLMSTDADKEVNLIKSQQRKVQLIQKNCEYCGQTHRHRACPANHKVCRYCKTVGHVEKKAAGQDKSVCRPEQPGRRWASAKASRVGISWPRSVQCGADSQR